jgi:hypothetical protein
MMIDRRCKRALGIVSALRKMRYRQSCKQSQWSFRREAENAKNALSCRPENGKKTDVDRTSRCGKCRTR